MQNRKQEEDRYRSKISGRPALTIGQLVSLKIPNEDRSGLCLMNRVAKILSIDDMGYLELQTEVGVISDKIHFAEVNVWQGYEPANLRTAPNTKVALVTAFRSVTSYGNPELEHCACASKGTACSTKRCACKKNNVQCGSRCKKCLGHCKNRD